jgi:hypothetical protein
LVLVLHGSDYTPLLVLVDRSKVLRPINESF